MKCLFESHVLPLVCAALMLGLGSGVAAAQPAPTGADARAAFEQLAALAGAWQHESSPVAVDFRLSAGGSVVVETWTLKSGRESLTLYHLDGDRLLATHYCPQGNQPRLELTERRPDGSLVFALESVTNLSPDGSHQHDLELKLGPEQLIRTEVYRSRKGDSHDVYKMRRVPGEG